MLIGKLRNQDANFTRLSPELFCFLLERIGPHITKCPLYKALTAALKLVIILHFLATSKACHINSELLTTLSCVCLSSLRSLHRHPTWWAYGTAHYTRTLAGSFWMLWCIGWKICCYQGSEEQVDYCTCTSTTNTTSPLSSWHWLMHTQVPLCWGLIPWFWMMLYLELLSWKKELIEHATKNLQLQDFQIQRSCTEYLRTISHQIQVSTGHNATDSRKNFQDGHRHVHPPQHLREVKVVLSS